MAVTRHSFERRYRRPGSPLFGPVSVENLVADLYADHRSQKALCGMVDKIIPHAAMPTPEVAALGADVLHYLAEDLPRHAAKEEHELFHLLATTVPEQVLEPDFERLRAFHARDRANVERIIGDLAGLADGYSPIRPTYFMKAAARFVDDLQDHLTWENETWARWRRRSRLGRPSSRARALRLPARSAAARADRD